MQLSKNFLLSEFSCPCKVCEKDKLLDLKLITLLQVLRVRVGKPLHISSGGGIRCNRYNELIGGYVNSPHVEGKAADIYVKGMSYVKLAKLAKEVGFDRVGIYPFTYSKFIHVDIIPKNTSGSWVRDREGSYYYFNLLDNALKSVRDYA